MLAVREHEFTALHAQHFTRVYRYIAYRISDQARAEELASDVFRIVWEKQLHEPPGIGWLIATARNVLGNEYKGRRRREQLVERLEAEARTQATGGNDGQRAAVADVLQRLNDRDREVLMLSYWDDLTTAELAESLKCSPSAAAVRLHRARKAFAKAAPAHLMTERKG
ncbi:sigma-70 family RNA polymerase sigma factor [Pseudarthrobacter sp. J75]|uniref:RNA polymerase sigma factor n=1 Tax=unclassified Pseudarthrobacter TaxID=2647000 RepID=UPI002E806C50|nr:MULTISPECIES: sigma-70 family RNA polymerase sigma factor [unclassified Pseudarthrobacter]MEE2524472.1 sigma-70 family RNA polymerase sigma factor [Pseudarthrobacter sp. J47]MEE2530660.1 sigma-70 family RNA polymerase sigma factor [Pseudarthrobacter sp. J75]MEE2569547.1 sigma-70 family RNA polymerase sigma factor [Pseudarthrobacter sp. J64]